MARSPLPGSALRSAGGAACRAAIVCCAVEGSRRLCVRLVSAESRRACSASTSSEVPSAITRKSARGGVPVSALAPRRGKGGHVSHGICSGGGPCRRSRDAASPRRTRTLPVVHGRAMPRRATSCRRTGFPTPAGGCRSASPALCPASAANRKQPARQGAGRDGGREGRGRCVPRRHR